MILTKDEKCVIVQKEYQRKSYKSLIIKQWMFLSDNSLYKVTNLI
jgi:hypothetical protein